MNNQQTTTSKTTSSEQDKPSPKVLMGKNAAAAEAQRKAVPVQNASQPASQVNPEAQIVAVRQDGTNKPITVAHLRKWFEIRTPTSVELNMLDQLLLQEESIKATRAQLHKAGVVIENQRLELEETKGTKTEEKVTH